MVFASSGSGRSTDGLNRTGAPSCLLVKIKGAFMKDSHWSRGWQSVFAARDDPVFGPTATLDAVALVKRYACRSARLHSTEVSACHTLVLPARATPWRDETHRRVAPVSASRAFRQRGLLRGPHVGKR